MRGPENNSTKGYLNMTVVNHLRENPELLPERDPDCDVKGVDHDLRKNGALGL